MIDIPAGNTASALALQFRLQQTQTLPLKEQSRLVDQRLTQLLQHALQTVPYYRNHPEIIRMQGKIDWQRFPILTRANLQKAGTTLQSESPPESHGKAYEFRSSGSTGRPVVSYSSDYAQMFWRAQTVRDHLWAGRDLSGHMAAIKYQAPEKARYPGVSQGHWGPASATLGYSGKMSTLNSIEPLELQYRWLTEIQPDYLLTYPSNLLELAKIHRRMGAQLSLKGISTLGETLTPEMRQYCRTAFSCRVADMYSSQEMGYMALQCPRHDHYHIQLENCIVEILDDNNAPCRPGQTGRVVVTSLQNYIMPLLRYEIGDYAIAGAGCDCGITLPVIKRVIGRTRNLVKYPDGRKSWPSYNPMALMDLVPDAQFQLEQVSATGIVVHLVSDNPPDKAREKQMMGIIQEAMGYPFDIEIRITNEIPRAASGKFEEFVCRI